MASQPDTIQTLREDFRHCLDFFYATLKLAPPYHSVEKAITHLTATVKAMPLEDQEQIADDPGRKWTLYLQAFVESGLSQKHRGIIAGLVRSGQVPELPAEYETFLRTFAS